MLTARKTMDVVAAFRDVGTYRGAAEICGVDPKTVKRKVLAHEAGALSEQRAARAPVPKKTDVARDLVAQRVEKTKAKVTAKRLLVEARAVGYVGSGRNFRRLVAEEKKQWRSVNGRQRRHWEETLALETLPHLTVDRPAIDRALAAMGDFADLSSPYLRGHSAGVAKLSTSAAEHLGLGDGHKTLIRRGALVHDMGRVAVPVRIWQQAGPLTPDDWEQVRLHAYHTERVLTHSPFLAAFSHVASFHHERLDGSGYHRGAASSAIAAPARLLAAADVYHAMTEPRPHREAHTSEKAAEILGREAKTGRLDPDAVTAVLEAAGQPVPPIDRPAGLTDRESQVVRLVARGLQTKQIARALEISPKTADQHIQNAYRKMGVSTRAATALFAMEHGLLA